MGKYIIIDETTVISREDWLKFTKVIKDFQNSGNKKIIKAAVTERNGIWSEVADRPLDEHKELWQRLANIDK